MDELLITELLRQELDNSPPEAKMSILKKRISEIKDDTLRNLVETILEVSIGAHQPVIAPPQIVVLIHGIRTHGFWQHHVASLLETQCKMKVFKVKYGYLTYFDFWCPLFTRGLAIRRTVREIRRIHSDYPSANLILICHSFGTYVVSKILKKHTDIVINRLIFCGSIVNEKFRWDRIPRLPQGGFVNDFGLKDIMPVLAKCFSWGYGSSGTFGFDTALVSNRPHCIGHNDYFERSFINQYWVPFIRTGTVVTSTYVPDDNDCPRLYTFLNVFPLQYISAIGLIIFALYCIRYLFTHA